MREVDTDCPIGMRSPYMGMTDYKHGVRVRLPRISPNPYRSKQASAILLNRGQSTQSGGKK